MEKKIRVLMVGSAPAVRGGMSSVVRQILAHEFEDVSIRYVPTHVSGSAVKRMLVFGLGLVKLLPMLAFTKVDVVHMHMSYKGSFFRKYWLHRLVKCFGKKDVIHLHGSEFKKFYETAKPSVQAKIRRLLGECDRMIVLGESWAETVTHMEPKTRTVILRNAVAIPEKTAAWNAERTELLYLGVLIPRKCVDDILHSFELLRKALPERNLHLTIVGTGAQEAELKALCTNLGLDPWVDFAGWTDGAKKQALLEQAQCMVMASENEGLPVSILEALAWGIPVISTPVGSITEAVVDGRTGFTAPVHDPAALADAMGQTIRDRETWEALSAGARALALEQFDEESFFRGLETLYRELSGKNE